MAEADGAECGVRREVRRTNPAAALFLGAQLLVVACNTQPQERGGESHAPTTPAATSVEASSEMSGPPTTIWIDVEILHVQGQVRSLLVLAERGR